MHCPDFNQAFEIHTDVVPVKNKNTDDVHISKNKILLSNEELQLILDEYSISNSILYNNIEEETEYLSTYENEWPGSIPRFLITEYNVKLGMLKIPIHLLVVNKEFEICRLKGIGLLEMGENQDKLLLLNIMI